MKDFISDVSHYKGIVEIAVDAVVERTISSSSKAFSIEQLNSIKAYMNNVDEQTSMKQHLEELWEMALQKIKKDNVRIPIEWKEDAKQEILDLAEGKVRDQSQGWKW